MQFFAAVLLAVAGVNALVTPIDSRDLDFSHLEKRGCSVGAPNQGVIDTAYKTAKSRGLSYKLLVTVFETMAVESNYNNLNCGDQDSLGAFQQRPSMKVWGTASEIMNVAHATNAFIDAALDCANKHPNYSSGQTAQCAQVSEFPDRYDQQESRAKSILAEAIKRNGGSSNAGGAINVATKPSSGSGKSTSSSSTSGCKTHRTAKKGDTCSKLASAGGISLSKFYSLNSKVNSKCTNLQVGASYCIAAGTTSKASTGTSKATTSSGSCKQHYTAKSGDNCSKLAGKGGISVSKFLSLNGKVNSKCTNLQVGTSYCVKA
ncbi:hypothetical protein EXIGLDRAFT_693828 [Exidia glandulosa HHB12029]|uniref:LysM domain-containing protein n=1 Tax=Exidia glandulosa HHB12029 TaxID=1314781 RepID=A0A165NQE7_EXIGL|nr:hypothetical protein EXIGLDRAFT_693828 [Exidia glandulosa HHB12029]